MTFETLLEPFLGFFHCAGEEFNDDDVTMMEVAMTSSMTSNPALYSMPSKESMVEVRQDTIQRYGASPLFNGTASVPISFDDEMNNTHEEKRDDSMRSTSSRSTEVRQSLSHASTPPRTTVSTTSTPRRKSSQSTPSRNSLITS
ncbi:unnamed protein product [Cylindrotheca closterium]|uniref:Uncharacterized protein n=1 Tax=Cylindrotheca closterium TaxID=2856 RepID=A0AAD2FS33_9STRA|nr:unnamed protein product [Cylindrotheca closterium]